MSTHSDHIAAATAVGRLTGRELTTDEAQEVASVAAEQDAQRWRRVATAAGARPRVVCMPFRLPDASRATPTASGAPVGERDRIVLNVAPRDPRPQRGVTIDDPYGACAYDVVLTETGEIGYLAYRPHTGQSLATVRRLDEEQLALTAAAFLDDTADGPAIFGKYAAHDADAVPDPSLAYVGDILRLAERCGPRASARQALAAVTGRSLPTVDRWIRAARAADPSLPQATRDPRGIDS